MKVKVEVGVHDIRLRFTPLGYSFLVINLNICETIFVCLCFSHDNMWRSHKKSPKNKFPEFLNLESLKSFFFFVCFENTKILTSEPTFYDFSFLGYRRNHVFKNCRNFKKCTVMVFLNSDPCWCLTCVLWLKCPSLITFWFKNQWSGKIA